MRKQSQHTIHSSISKETSKKVVNDLRILKANNIRLKKVLVGQKSNSQMMSKT